MPLSNPIYIAPGQQVYVDDAAARAAAIPERIGQLLFQTDTGKFYKATGLSAGNWSGDFSFAGAVTTGGNILITNQGTLTFRDADLNDAAIEAIGGDTLTINIASLVAAKATLTGDGLIMDPGVKIKFVAAGGEETTLEAAAADAAVVLPGASGNIALEP